MRCLTAAALVSVTCQYAQVRSSPPPAPILDQSFRWDDAGGGGRYEWGKDGFLKMDGSAAPIRCVRKLSRPIAMRGPRLSFTALFVVGRQYRVALYGSGMNPVVILEIWRNGGISVQARAGKVAEPVAAIGTAAWRQQVLSGGEPAVARSSPLHEFDFGDFDFQARTFTLMLDGTKQPALPLLPGEMDVDRFEIATVAVEAGSLVWLRSFRYLDESGRPVEEENFHSHWIANTAVTPRYPADKWQATSYRPVDFRWLEMATHYGAVYCRFADRPVVAGTLTMELQADEAGHEVQVNLGEYRYDPAGTFGYLPADAEGISTITGGWNIDAGMFNGAWSPFQHTTPNSRPTIMRPYPTFVPFDDPPPAESGRVYGLKIHWNIREMKYQVWVDGRPQVYRGSTDLPVMAPPVNGIDMIMMHAGNLNPWRGPLIHMRFGNVKVEADSESAARSIR